MNNLEKPTEDQIPFKCEICDKEFKSNNGLKKHFNVVHNLEGEHQCNICQKFFNIKSQLNWLLYFRTRTQKYP